MPMYSLYSVLASDGVPVDLSPLFLTTGVADPSYQNLTWQLAIQDEGISVWTGDVNPDGSLSQGTAPSNFTTDGTVSCNSVLELQISFNPDPSMCAKCNQDASGQTSGPASPTTYNSVELATGKFVFQKPIVSLAALGSGGWSFDLNYKSNSGIDGILGKNFAYPQFIHLETLTGGYLYQNDVQLVTNQVTRSVFINNGSGVFAPAAGNNSGARLVVQNQFTTSEEYVLTAPDGTVTTFYGFNYYDRDEDGLNITNPAPGQIKSMVDRYGNTQTHLWGNTNSYIDDSDETIYDGVPQLLSVTDSYGRIINYSYYGAEGGYRVQQITDFLGRQINFQYDSNDHLIAVVTPAILKAALGNTFPGGTAYVFQYDVGNANPARRDDLIKIWYPNQTQPYLNAATRSVDVQAVYTNATPRYEINYGQNITDVDTYGKVLAETLGDPENEVGGTATFGYTTCSDDLPVNIIDPLLPPPTDSPPSPFYGGCPIVSRTIYTDRNGNRTLYDFGASVTYTLDGSDWVKSSTPNWTVSRMEVQLNRSKNSLELDNEDNGGVATPPFVTWTRYNAQNQPTYIVYPEGDSTEYAYDDGMVSDDPTTYPLLSPYIPRVGLLLSETRFAGNSISLPSRSGSNGQNQLTKTYFYEPIYQRLCGFIDERGNPIDVVDGANVYFDQELGPTPTDSDRSRYATLYTFDYQKNDFGTTTADVASLLGLTADQVGMVIDYVNEQMLDGGLPGGFVPNSSAMGGLGDINGDGTGSGSGSGLPDATSLGSKVETALPAVLQVDGTSQTRTELYTVNARGQITTTTDPEGNLTVIVRYPENDPEGTGQIVTTASTQQYGLVREIHRDTNPDNVMSLVGASGDLVDFIPGLITRNNTPGVYQDLVTRYEGSNLSGFGCTTCGYDAMGNVLSETDPRGFTTVYDRNELGKVYRVTSPAPYNFKVENYYDANGNVVRVDREDQQVQYNSPDPTSASYGTFTPTGSGTTAQIPMIPGPGGALRPGWFTNLMAYDILDNKIEDDIDATGSTPANLITRYEYDPNQNLIKITKPEGNTVEIDYDERNLKIAERVGYDAATDQPGGVTAYSYDGNGNLLNIIGPVVHSESEVFLTVYIADAFSSGFRLTQAGDWVLSNTYDGFNRVITASDANVTLGFKTLTYDPASNVLETQFQGLSPDTLVPLSHSYFRFDEAMRLYEEEREVFMNGGLYSGRTVTHTGGGLAANSTANDHTGTVTLTSGESSYVLTRIIYDRSSRAVNTLADNTAQTTYAYDGANRRILVTDPLGNTLATQYDGNSNPVQTTRTDVCTVTTPTVDNEVFVSFTWFDCLNRPVVAGTQGADGNLTSNLNLCCPWQGLPSTLFSLIGYDSRGNKVTVTDPKVNVVVSVFDGASRLIETQQEMRQNGDGRNAPANNQTFLTAGGGLIRTEYLYDGNSRLIELVDDRGGSTYYAYDTFDRLLTRTLADGSVSTRVYDASSCLTGYTDENGSVFANTYDSLSRMVSTAITPATGVAATTTSQTFIYDGLSRLIEAQDTLLYSTGTAFSYDSLSRVLEELWGYEGVSDQITTHTKWTSYVTTQLTYPASSNTGSSTDDISVTNTYDLLYRKQGIMGVSVALGTLDTVDWEFFGRRRVAETNYGDGSLIATQMNNARTHSAVQATVPLPGWGDISSDRLGYDGVGRQITKRYLTGGIDGDTGAYNNTTALVGYTTSFDRASNKLYERHLEAESRSHLYQPFNSDGSFAVGYDSADRLLQYQRGVLSSATIPYRVNPGASVSTPITLPDADQIKTYGLDGLGNWKTSNFTEVNGDGSTTSTAEVRQHNYVNQITRVTDTIAGTATPTPFTYDHGNNTGEAAQRGNGNILNDGLRIYLYDALNRPVQVTSVASGLVIATYRYDALNRRVQKTISNGGLTGDVTNGTSNFYYDGQQLIEKRGGGSPNNWGQLYFWGQYIDELLFFTAAAEGGGVTYRVLSDLLYRTTAVVDTSNNIFEAFDCDAYGNTLCYSGPGDDGIWFTDDDVQTNNPVNSTIFTGRRFDIETQLYYYRARIYSPSIGRFISRDPIGVAGGINLYSYCGGNPVNRLDPMGFDGITTDDDGNVSITVSTTMPWDNGQENLTYNLPPGLQNYQPASTPDNSNTGSPQQQAQNWSNQQQNLNFNLPPDPSPTPSYWPTGLGTPTDQGYQWQMQQPSLTYNPNDMYSQQDNSTCPWAMNLNQVPSPQTSNWSNVATALGGVGVAGAIVTTAQFTALAAGFIAAAPFAAGVVAFAGGVMVGLELYEAFENLERGQENKGPAFGPIHIGPGAND